MLIESLYCNRIMDGEGKKEDKMNLSLVTSQRQDFHTELAFT